MQCGVADWVEGVHIQCVWLGAGMGRVYLSFGLWKVWQTDTAVAVNLNMNALRWMVGSPKMSCGGDWTSRMHACMHALHKWWMACTLYAAQGKSKSHSARQKTVSHQMYANACTLHVCLLSRLLLGNSPPSHLHAQPRQLFWWTIRYPASNSSAVCAAVVGGLTDGALTVCCMLGLRSPMSR